MQSQKSVRANQGLCVAYTAAGLETRRLTKLLLGTFFFLPSRIMLKPILTP
jgi:hypothetical protein